MSGPLRWIYSAKWVRRRPSIRLSGSTTAFAPKPTSSLPPIWRSNAFGRSDSLMTSYASLPGPGPSISMEDFLKFKEFFYRRTGISFEASKRYFVDKRLVERIEATRTANFRGYFTMLRFQASGEELQQLTNLMTVNETYFLREEYQFKCLVDSILPEIVRHRTGSDAIRIWCIHSSSGEASYSIAMYLLEKWSGIPEWDVEIVSSDIDTASCTVRAAAAIRPALCRTCHLNGWGNTSRAPATNISSATICAKRSNLPGSISQSPPIHSPTVTSMSSFAVTC